MGNHKNLYSFRDQENLQKRNCLICVSKFCIENHGSWCYNFGMDDKTKVALIKAALIIGGAILLAVFFIHFIPSSSYQSCLRKCNKAYCL